MKARIWNHSAWIEGTEPKQLKREYDNILRKSGFSIFEFQEHYFEPTGYTALWLLGESHFALHTFPEENKSHIELSSCNEKMYENFKVINEKEKKQ